MTHLRHDNGNGTSKDWIVEINPNGGLTIQYGRTGSILRRTEIPASACKGGVNAEMQSRIAEKTRKGYVPVSDVNDPELQKARARLDKEARAREREKAMKEMARIKASEAPPPTWF